MRSENQAAKCILMIKPHRFFPNEETMESNSFQSTANIESFQSIHQKAIVEFDNMVEMLRKNQIQTIVVDDKPDSEKPDCIFPNNWFSTHENGNILLYPLEANNRRNERRRDIFEMLSSQYEFSCRKIIDLSYYENEEKYLESTGSLVLDRINKIAYMSKSTRSHSEVLNTFCKLEKYKSIEFDTLDHNKIPIYHTNVLMSVGKKFAVVCLEVIHSNKDMVVESLQNTKHEIISISMEQLKHFSGNVLQVKNKFLEDLLVISQQALDSLTKRQIKTLEKYVKIIPISIDNIEKYGGGGVRCMMAEIFLPLNSLT